MDEQERFNRQTALHAALGLASTSADHFTSYDVVQAAQQFLDFLQATPNEE